MNRIYQGRVSSVQTLIPGRTGRTAGDWEPLDEFPKAAKAMGEELLFRHHELFQDAVNYYIMALASLGSSPDSKLTHLARLLEKVWDAADKKGQKRQGMRESLMRSWQLFQPITLDDALNHFRNSVKENGVSLEIAEKAGEFLLFNLGGESAIKTGARDFFPMFCDFESSPTYKLSVERRGRAEDEKRLQFELHQELTDSEIKNLAKSISLASVVNLQPDAEDDLGDAVIARIKAARATFPDQISEELLTEWLSDLDESFSLPKNRGGNINTGRVNACILFLAFPNKVTKALFQGTFSAPTPVTASKKKPSACKENADPLKFLVDGDDPIKLARGSRGFVFKGFTALPIWKTDGVSLAWNGFDIAAFKEALKVFNQFQQNVEKREERLNELATKLLVMDGEQAINGYSADTDKDRKIRERLERIWRESNGKPKLPAKENGDEDSLPRFKGDKRIERMRRIVNDDLAEEYRLTDGRKTPYGLRRRTMKGWGDVKRKWQGIAKTGMSYSAEVRQSLNDALDEMRGGEKREQIGSHKLFEALIADEEAWSIWQEPDPMFATLILNNEWAADPLEAFRMYCEIREAIEDISDRPLNFTPADAQYSRRLFNFIETCSFGKDGGEFKHDPNELAATLPVAVRDEAGRFSMQRMRICYSAPRLLRDQIRGDGGAYVQDWTQPMMKALFGDQEGFANHQKLKDAAVQLMPDYDSKGERRVLLNFPLDLNEEAIIKQLGKAALWENQFRTWNKKLTYLCWPEEFNGKERHRWWEESNEFRVLAADLGTRHAASVALVECCAVKSDTSRHIGNAGGRDWYATFRIGTILRLPGEDAKVRPHERGVDKKVGKKGQYRVESSGERGRLADDNECLQTIEIIRALCPSVVEENSEAKGHGLLGGIDDASSLQKRFSFPEQNDKLLVAVRRAQSWIATCISWHWKLSQTESGDQRKNALQQLFEQKRKPEWRGLAEGTDGSLEALRDALFVEIQLQRKLVQKHLLDLTGRILPLRGRTWEWVLHPEQADCHLLRQTQEGTAPTKVPVRGQRGLSMARIEQLSELRRRWQSLNQSLRREIGQKPPTASEMRNDPIPDPCPDILVKLENIREQRVNQTAHLILAQALGLRLKTPEMDAKRRKITDTHGEYEVARPPADFIVLEDLSRYLSDQGRARSENSRLMKWCHRAVLNKVKMLAEPFGISVLETQAAYSSRFCSLTGIAGFRAAEVGWNDRNTFRWRVLLDEAEEAGTKASDNAKFAAKLFSRLEEINATDKPHRTLLAPQPGGPIFVTAKSVEHPAPSPKRDQSGDTSVLPVQADVNAAVNLALRAVAHPKCVEIHHRIRTVRIKGKKGQQDRFEAREPRRFGKEKVEISPKEENGIPKERNPNVFFDGFSVAKFGWAQLATDGEGDFHYSSGPGLWKAVNDRTIQWCRCNEVNQRRLNQWGFDTVASATGASAAYEDFDDEIPMIH